MDLFASSDNNQCGKFYSLHWCRGTAGVNAFGFLWIGENCWINAPYRVIGRVWRSLLEQGAVATILVPLWQSATWWLLIAPDAIHLSEFVVDWMWLPRTRQDLFLGGCAPGRAVYPPDWPVMALRVDFSPGRRIRCPLSKRQRCVYGGCSACWSSSWHRSQ